MRGLQAKQYLTEYFDAGSGRAHQVLGEYLLHYMRNVNLTVCTPIILCIGTDRATGDCLGPLVGEQLLNFSENFRVMGCLSEPVHALNLREVIFDIRSNYENPFVIAVDASLGSISHVGYVTITDGPIAPGKGVHKKLPAIGDISITGIVNVAGQHPGLLQSTRLYTVMQLADCIASALKLSISSLESLF